MREPKILVNLKNSQRKWQINLPVIRKFLQSVTTASLAVSGRNVAETELTVVFLNDRRMRYYNKQFRGKDCATDVLSFSVDETLEQKHYLGDIVISMERTAAQAKTKQHSFHRELKILLLHGVLHLLGYDHETDDGTMERLERHLRRQLL